MSDPFTAIGQIGSFIGGAAGGIMSGIASLDANQISRDNLAAQKEWNNRNFQLQQQNLDYIKHRDQITMEREDNATQRRVADLEAAGMSPILAAGSPAAASSGPITSAPQGQAPQKGNEGVMAKMQFANMLNQIGMSTAELSLLKERVRGMKIDNDAKENKEWGTLAQFRAQIQGQNTQRDLALQRLSEDQWDFAKTKLMGVPKGIDPSSMEGWLYMMNDPNVPDDFKIAFGIKGTWSEIKDVWRTFIGKDSQVTHTHVRSNTK